MKLPLAQLQQHLAKTLAPLYIISSDELLLAQEAMDQIRHAGQKAGFTERHSLTVDTGSDWGKLLYAESHALSLFATKRLIEIHLGSTKPNAATSKILQDIAATPLPDTLLLISAAKWDSKTEQTQWYKALEKNGVALQIWPVASEQLPTWIMQRATQKNIKLTPDAAKFLADQVEGNLLAASQEIEKLGLLNTQETIDRHTIETMVTDNARYDIFSLVECALAGNSKRVERILKNLRAEDTEPLLILWALTRETRTMASMANELKRGVAIPSLFTKYRIWEKRQANVRRFLQQQSYPACLRLLSHAAKIDRIIKGAAGNVWDELMTFALSMSGNAILSE